MNAGYEDSNEVDPDLEIELKLKQLKSLGLF